jgi:hypothetical protein
MAEVVTLATLGAVALALAATTDAAGALLGVAAGVGLLALATVDAVVRPRLAADRTGLSVRSPSYRLRLAWSDVDRVAVDERSRVGVRVRTLEIDTGGTLLVLGRHALGADPREVHAALLALRGTPQDPAAPAN